MKKSIIITGIIFVLGITTLSAQSTPRVDQRQHNQRARIVNGVQDGALTPRETRRLARQQAKIKQLERRANADGVITAKERVRIEKAQDKANRTIARKKHNARDRN